MGPFTGVAKHLVMTRVTRGHYFFSTSVPLSFRFQFFNFIPFNLKNKKWSEWYGSNGGLFSMGTQPVQGLLGGPLSCDPWI
jgi:hypothetical protein